MDFCRAHVVDGKSQLAETLAWALGYNGIDIPGEEAVVLISARPQVDALSLYSPGQSLADARRLSGREQMIKLASNESLWGPSPRAIRAVETALETVQYYPAVQPHGLVEALADVAGLHPDDIVVGNGADEILRLVATAFSGPGDEILFPHPSFSAYRHSTVLSGATPVAVSLADDGANDLERILDAVSSRTRIVYLCSPNNPTGTPFGVKAWEDYLNQVPDTVLTVVDAAYREFQNDPVPDYGAAISSGRPVVMVRTFSKLYALAGFRVGWGAAPAWVINALRKVREPFSLNTLGALAAEASLKDTEYFSQVLANTKAARHHLIARLKDAGVPYFHTESNFVTIRVKDAERMHQALLGEGFVVRPTTSFGLPGAIRVTLAPEEILDEFWQAFLRCR